MAKNRRHVIYYLIQVDVTTTNRYQITLFDQALKMFLRAVTITRKQVRAKILNTQELDLKKYPIPKGALYE